MNDEVIVDIACIKHRYPGGIQVDVCGLEFQVRQGQRVAVLGPNGAGKSTLLKHVLGILRADEGTISVFGMDPSRHYRAISPRIGAMMQNVDEQLIGPTVFDDVAFSPLNFGYSRDETLQRVEQILHALNIYHLRDRLPHYLSGGERKKVALAGALVTGPELLVMDEPMAGIDYASRREIVAFLQTLHEETGLAMISTMHDMEMVAEMADVGYVMRGGGRLELYGPILDLFFKYDLADYNLAPPTVVQIIKDFQSKGFILEPTLDYHELNAQLLRKLSGKW
ncbi:MAG TPA: ABC transporter ATP-binding protein [Armatimonadota bacterium]|jgi:cobalt/nickel transport system ATP-binding protein